MGSATASPLAGSNQLPVFIDPRTNLNVPLQLGSFPSFGSRPNADKRFYNIRYNHKPRKSKSTKRSTTLSCSNGTKDRTSDDRRTLSIRDEDDEGNARMYGYSGEQHQQPPNGGTASYALIYDPQTRRFTLEELSASYAFNLTGTPLEDNADKLSKLYGTVRDEPVPGEDGQLQTNGANDEGTTDDLFGESQNGGKDRAPTSPPDKGNPFDFRHYTEGLPPPVKISPGSLRPSPAPSQTASPAPTPRASPAPSHPTPRTPQTTTLTAGQKRKEAPNKPLPRPAKATKRRNQEDNPATTSTPIPCAKKLPTPIPSVQVQEHKAKSAHKPHSAPSSSTNSKTSPEQEEDEEEDDGGLIIEATPDSPPSRQRRDKARAGLGITTPGGGPISLRSVALSRSCSPAVRPAAGAEGKDGGVRRSALSNSESWGEAVEDGDVEELKLGSPAVNGDNGGGAEDSEEGGEEKVDEEQENGRRESEDAFARAMQEAMYESELDADGAGEETALVEEYAPTTQQQQEEEEESEEE